MDCDLVTVVPSGKVVVVVPSGRVVVVGVVLCTLVVELVVFMLLIVDELVELTVDELGVPYDVDSVVDDVAGTDDADVSVVVVLLVL